MNDTVSVHIDRAQLLHLIRYDCETILAFYLGEELTLEIPEFHKELWDEFLDLLDQVNNPEMLTGILKKLLGVPREHAKTTLVKIAIILFFRYSRLSFCAYISNTFAAAINALKDVKAFLESKQDQELYGALEIEKSSDTEGLYILRISTPDGRRKTVIMKAFGVNTQIRGTLIHNRRPDLMIFDDCESNETASSETQQAKLDAWCLGTAMKSMAKLGICIFIGNMINEKTLLARLTREPDWRPTVFGCIIRSATGNLRPLWEGRWSLESLLQDYASYRRLGSGHVWEAEMMNLTANEILGESLDGIDKPPRPMPDEIEAGFLCLDPAFGDKAWHDESAITVHVLQRGAQIPIIVESWHGKAKEEQLLDEMIRLSYYWGITTWAIESVAAQKLLISLFRLMLVQRQMSADLFLMLPITAGKDSKASRIVSFRSIVAKGSYGICETESELIQKLGEYTALVEHEDLEDSASYGTIVWNLHGALVKGQGRVNVAGLLMGNHGNDQALSGLDMGI